jgi:hypothetical protein
VVEGLLLSVLGGLCIEDVLVGDCMGAWNDLPPSIQSKMGLTMNQVGPCMFIPGLFWTGYKFMDGANKCGFIIGYWLCVLGFVPLGFGLACIDDHLYNLQDGGSFVDCGWSTDAGKANRGTAVEATMAGILVAFTGLCTLAWWREPVRLRLKKICTTIPFVLGVLQFAAGTGSTYYGWWCMEGLAPDCKPTGIVLLSVGPSLIVLGVYCVFICYFWWYPGMEKGDAPPGDDEGDKDDEGEANKAIREKFMPISMGTIMSFAGSRLLWKGVEALVGAEHGTYSHNFGVVNTVLGAFMLFVGLNFLATAWFRVPKTEGRPPGEPTYVLMALSSVSGLTLLVFSTMCMGGNLRWMGEDNCEEVDAAILFLVGLGTLVFSLVPLGFINIERRHPGAIKEHRLTFYPGFFLFFCPGVAAFFAGVACANDVLLLVKSCNVTHGTGHWPLLVKGIVFGLIFAFIGWFLCSFTINGPMYAKIWRRTRATWSHSWIKVGIILMALGVIASGFGGSCLDNTLFWVVNCPRDHLGVGVTLVSLGPSMFVFGLFAAAMVIDWRWEDVGDLSAAAGADEAQTGDEDLALPPVPPRRPDPADALQEPEPEPQPDEMKLASRLLGGDPDVPPDFGSPDVPPDFGPEPEPEPEQDSGPDGGADDGSGVVFNPMRTASAASDASLDEGGGGDAGEPEADPEPAPMSVTDVRMAKRAEINAKKAEKKREKKEKKEAVKVASAEEIAAARAAKEAARHADWIPHSPRMRTVNGMLFLMIGVTLEFLGGSCINESLLFAREGSRDTFAGWGLNDTILADQWAMTFDGGGCDRYKGIIMVTVGSSSLYIGLLFLACIQAERGTQVFHRFALDALVFGTVWLLIGRNCMVSADCRGSTCPGTSPFRSEAGCNWNDGVIMVFSGSCMLAFMALIPWILSTLMRHYPETVRKTGFAVGFGLVSLCIVVSTVGHLCQADNLFRVQECHRKGLWRPSPHSGRKWAYWVRLVVTGWLGISFGVLFMLDAIFPHVRVQTRERIQTVRSYKSVLIGQSLMVLGFIFSAVGGACTDDTFPSVEDCRGLGAALLSLGPALFAFGSFLVAFTCEWVVIKTEANEYRSGTIAEIRVAIEEAAAHPDAQAVAKGKKMAYFGSALMTTGITVNGVMVYDSGPTAVKKTGAIFATLLAVLGLIIFSFGLALIVNEGYDNSGTNQRRWRKSKKEGAELDATSSHESAPSPGASKGSNVLAGMGLGGKRRKETVATSQNTADNGDSAQLQQQDAEQRLEAQGRQKQKQEEREQQEQQRQQEELIRMGLGIGGAPRSPGGGWSSVQAHTNAMSAVNFMSTLTEQAPYQPPPPVTPRPTTAGQRGATQNHVAPTQQQQQQQPPQQQQQRPFVPTRPQIGGGPAEPFSSGLAPNQDWTRRPSLSYSQPGNLQLGTRMQGGGGASGNGEEVDQKVVEKARKKEAKAAEKERKKQEKADAKLKKQEEKEAKQLEQARKAKESETDAQRAEALGPEPEPEPLAPDVHLQPEPEPEPEPEPLSRSSFELTRDAEPEPEVAKDDDNQSTKKNEKKKKDTSNGKDKVVDEEDEEEAVELRTQTAKLSFALTIVGIWLAILGYRCIWTVPAGALDKLSTNDTAFSREFSQLSGHMDDFSGAITERIEGGCPRHRGVILLSVGASTLFVGILGLSCKSATSGLQVWQGFAGDSLVFGVVLLFFGNSCVEETDWSSNWTNPGVSFGQSKYIGCDGVDAAIMLLVSGVLLTLSLVPSAVVYADRRHGAIVRQRPFLIGLLIFCVGFIIAQFGLACATNELWTVEDCPRHGHWNTSVKLLFWGWMMVAIGTFVMSVVWFPTFYAKILRRGQEVAKLASWKPQLAMKIGFWGFLILGILFASFGGACLDNTLFSDCREKHLGAGVVFVSLGPSMFVFGLFTVIMAMDWRWTEIDGDAPIKAADPEPEPEPEPGEPGGGPVMNPMRTASAQSDAAKEEATAPVIAADLNWVPESPTLRWWLGLWLGLIGLVLNIVGISCINHTLFFSVSGSGDSFATIGLNDTFLSDQFAAHLEFEEGCERYKGVIMVTVGSSSLFIGILFYLCEKASTFVDVCLYFTGDAFAFGFALTLVGSGCMEMHNDCKRCPRAEPAGCNWTDGVVMVFVGLWLAIAMAAVPYIWYTLWKYYPEVVKQRTFQIGAAVWLVGVLLFVPGLLCESDNMYGVDRCQTKGRLWNHKWSHSVKLLFSGFMFVMIGLFVMSTKMFPRFYEKVNARTRQLKKRVPIVLGLFLCAVGVVLASVGGACLDNTLVFVDDCFGDYQPVGVSLVTVGPSMFAFGVLFFMLACDWQYDFDPDGPAPANGRDNGEKAPLAGGSLQATSSGIEPEPEPEPEPQPEPEQEQLNPFAEKQQSKPATKKKKSQKEKQKKKQAKAPKTQAGGLARHLAPSYFRDFAPVMAKRESPRIVLGAVFVFLGVSLSFLGGACINQTDLAPECQRHKGTIMVTVGATALFVGIIFLGSAFSRTHVQLLSVIAVDTFSFGFVLWVVGALCMGDSLPGVVRDEPAGCNLNGSCRLSTGVPFSVCRCRLCRPELLPRAALSAGVSPR